MEIGSDIELRERIAWKPVFAYLTKRYDSLVLKDIVYKRY